MNFFLRAGVFLLLTLIAIGSNRVDAQVPNFLVNAADRADMVHDLNSDILYVTNGDEIVRYDIGNRSLLAPIAIPGANLLGIDLSPDGNTLSVTDRNEANSQENRVHIIDTNSLNQREVRFQQQSLESGTWSTSFTSNSEVLVTSSFAGSGNVPLRLLNLNNDTTQTLISVRQNTMLTPSADLSVVAFAEANSSGGPFGRYRIADGEIAENGTNSFNYEIGVSRDASQYAIPGFSGLEFYDADLNFIEEVSPGSTAAVIGLAYSPVADLVYLAWHSFDGSETSIQIWDTNTLESIGTIDSSDQFDWIGNGAFREGRLEVSRDGSYLFATVDGGVRVYETGIVGVPEPSMSIVLAAAGLTVLSRRRRGL